MHPDDPCVEQTKLQCRLTFNKETTEISTQKSTPFYTTFTDPHISRLFDFKRLEIVVSSNNEIFDLFAAHVD